MKSNHQYGEKELVADFPRDKSFELRRGLFGECLFGRTWLSKGTIVRVIKAYISISGPLVIVTSGTEELENRLCGRYDSAYARPDDLGSL